MLKAGRTYFLTPLPAELTTKQQFRLLLMVFGLTFASVVTLHQMLPLPQPLSDLFVHAGLIALTYTVSMILLGAMLYLLRQKVPVDRILVWHVWLASFVGFSLGYFAVPLGEDLKLSLHPDLGHGNELFHFMRLMPVWLLMTYLFIQPYITQSLELEVQRLNEVNARLANQERPRDKPISEYVAFDLGKRRVQMEAHAIRHITVEDHYCYIHHMVGDQICKTEIALPLRDVLARLPKSFIQVHRSHVINPSHVTEVSRKGSSYVLTMDGTQTNVPISRHRMREVLPRLQTETTL